MPEAEGRALFTQEVREYKRWKGAAARYFASIQLAYQECKALIHEQSEKEGQRYAALSRALANDLYEFLRDDENLPPES